MRGRITQAARLLAAACATLLGAGIGVASAQESALAQNERMLRDPAMPGVLVAGHRACWKQASENSIDGIRACIALGIDIIEIDVRATSDGKLVLMHDATVDRMTDGHGKVSELTFDEIRKLRLKSANGGKGITTLTDRQVPTLEEALAAAKNHILIDMDAKAPVQERVFEAVRKVGMTDQVVMKMQEDPDAAPLAGSKFAFQSQFMPVIFACDAKLQIGTFCTRSLGDLLPRYARYHPVGFELNFENPDFVTPEVAAAARKMARLWVNSLQPAQAGGVSDATALDDPDGVWGKLIDQGFTVILTNHPEELTAYLRRRGLHR